MLVDEPEKAALARELKRVGGGDPPEDSQDLHVLSALEHRRGDEQPEERVGVAGAQVGVTDGEGSDARFVAEHADDAGVRGRAEVPLQVPANYGLGGADLRRTRSAQRR
ncbi:MAG: hypothetical protein IT374_03165 [Polyangiaceae bacterium]|nr:hypothetical protein [Polyangiaceae bacterium]